MTSQEVKVAAQIASLLRAARKRRGYSQLSVAKQIGVSQSALSKMESAILIPSAPQWFSFCEFTGISPDSLTAGFIDAMRPAVLERREKSMGFKVASRYQDLRGLKARGALPFLTYFKDALGQERLDEFFAAKRIDPDLFVDLDNLINFNFLIDISYEMISSGVLKSRDLGKLTRSVSQSRQHGNLQRVYGNETRSTALLSLLVKNARQYGCDFSCRVEENSVGKMVISVTPEEHLREFEYRKLGTLLCDYNKGFTTAFSTYGGAPPVTLTESECHFRGADRCVYHFQTS